MILVSGLINIETTLKVEGFPIHYTLVRYPFNEIRTTVSGVGYNIATALTTLGDPISLLSLVGDDLAGEQIRAALERAQISTDNVLALLPATPQSVILYDPQGQRMINTDLKTIQETASPIERAEALLQRAALAVLCNINYNRPLLARAHALGVPIATDVHALRSLDDDYNRDFMESATILFMSDINLPCHAADWAKRVMERYSPAILVIGMGEKGAYLVVQADNFYGQMPAFTTRPVVNTIGAGDALFSAFVHSYMQSHNPYTALYQASLFASFKIGGTGGADGFLTAPKLAEWAERLRGSAPAWVVP